MTSTVLEGIFAVESGRRDAGAVDDPIDRFAEVERFGDVVVEEAELGAIGEMRDALRNAAAEIIHADQTARFSPRVVVQVGDGVEEIAAKKAAASSHQQGRAGKWS